MNPARNCENCGIEVLGKLFKGKCRRCYDRSRKTTVVSIPKKIQPLFEEYIGERDDIAKCINELVELGLKTWKQGKRMILVAIE
jgi:hypothetical protein